VLLFVGLSDVVPHVCFLSFSFYFFQQKSSHSCVSRYKSAFYCHHIPSPIRWLFSMMGSVLDRLFLRLWIQFWMSVDHESALCESSSLPRWPQLYLRLSMKKGPLKFFLFLTGCTIFFALLPLLFLKLIFWAPLKIIF